VCVGGVCRVHAKDIFLNLHKNSAKSPMWDKLRITDRSTANGRAHSRLPHCMTGHHTVLGYSADRHSDRHIRLGEGKGLAERLVETAKAFPSEYRSELLCAYQRPAHGQLSTGKLTQYHGMVEPSLDP
jgi:hypothetical protein